MKARCVATIALALFLTPPAVASAAQDGEAPASAGPLDLSRRVVRHVEETGQDVAAYVRIRNTDPVTDELMAVACACAQRVELHRIDRSGAQPNMVTDAAWSVPARGELAVRPGSPLHFMLIGYDPSVAREGKVRLTLTFREAGTVEADFALTDDSAAAWSAFD